MCCLNGTFHRVELEFFSLGCSVKNELVVDTVIKKNSQTITHEVFTMWTSHQRKSCKYVPDRWSSDMCTGKLQEKSSGLHEVTGRGLHTKDLCCPCLQSARDHESELKKYQGVSLIRWSWALRAWLECECVHAQAGIRESMVVQEEAWDLSLLTVMH